MKEDFIMHPNDLLQLRSRMSPEQIGILVSSLCLSSIGEDPGEMEPVVGVAYDIFWDRIQREHEAYDKKAERNRINGRRHIGHKDQGESAATGAAITATNVVQGGKDRSDSTTQQEPGEPNIPQWKPGVIEGDISEPNSGLPIPNPNPNPIPNPVSQKEICASGKPDAPSDVTDEDQAEKDSGCCLDDSSACESSSAAKKKPNTNAEAEALFEKLWVQYPLKRGKGKVSAAKKRALHEIGEDRMFRALRRYIDEHNARERQGRFVPAWKNGDTFFNTDYVDYLDENYVAAPRDPPRHASACSGFLNYEQSDTDWDYVSEQIMRQQEEESLREMNDGSRAQKPAS